MDETQRPLATMKNDAFHRTEDSYERDVQLKNLSRTGIKEHCIIDGLLDFYATENLSVDMMRDFLIGVCEFDIVVINKYCTSKAKFVVLFKAKFVFLFKNCGFIQIQNLFVSTIHMFTIIAYNE